MTNLEERSLLIMFVIRKLVSSFSFLANLSREVCAVALMIPLKFYVHKTNGQFKAFLKTWYIDTHITRRAFRVILLDHNVSR